MIKKILFLIILLSVGVSASAQDSLWSYAYFAGEHGDYPECIRQTSDGMYVVAGWTNSFGAGNPDIFLMKMNQLGDTLWTRVYGDSLRENAYDVQETADGGYILAGRTSSFGAGGDDGLLIKTDSVGDVEWVRTFGTALSSLSDEFRSVQQTADGGYIVTGDIRNPGGSDVYLVKTDSAGDTLWTRAYGIQGQASEYGRSVLQTADGGYFVAAYTGDIYLIKTDSAGNLEWSRTYGGSYSDQAWSAQQTTGGGYIVAGYTRSFEAQDYDIFLMKIDSDGDTLWSRRYGGNRWDEANSVLETQDGGYLVVGLSSSFGGDNWDILVMKIDSNGDTLWSREFGSESETGEQGYSAVLTPDGSFLITAKAHILTADGDILITKVDSSGRSCLGRVVSPEVVSVSPTVTIPTTEVRAAPAVVTSHEIQVMSPDFEIDTICLAIRGDANGDRDVTISDVVYLVNYLFKSGPAPDPLWTGDANCDTEVNINDAVFLINYLFKGGPPPEC